MDYKEVYLGVLSTVKALVTSAPAKVIGTAFLSFVLHKHAVLFYAFVMLVFLDCFTRWAAISYQRIMALKEQAKSILEQDYEGIVTIEPPTFWETLVGIRAAREAGLISSDVMKHRFLGKIAVYLICVITAAVTDLVMKHLGQADWSVSLIVGYLVMTELLSIIENLNDAGIEAAKGLYNIVLKRKEAIK